MNQLELFISQKEILEKLFSLKWFLKSPSNNHPAYIRWDMCNRLIEQKGAIRFPEQEKELNQIGRLLLDSYLITQLTNIELGQFKFGSLDLYGDALIQKKIKSRIGNAEQFEDLMVELCVAAWHKTENHTVIPIEKNNYSDFKVGIPNVDLPVFIECKHLRSISKNRLVKEIAKSNSQIKGTGCPGYGVVVFHISNQILFEKVNSDSIPGKATEAIKIIQNTINGSNNKSVGVVIVTWDDYMIIGNPPNRTQVKLSRQNMYIPHTPCEGVRDIPKQ